jgi:hypothetical protein
MSQNRENICRLLSRALRGQPMSWSALECRASQVVLFGSRAAGIAGIDSDWDLLCVGEGTSVHNGKIDLVWLSPMQLATDRWLGSELASHVAVYGQWLVGEDSWSHRVSISPEAVHHKRQSILFQLSELKRLWSSIVPGFRAKHLRRFRRDVQRLHCLIEKRAVPPTRMLDDLWDQSGMPPEELECLLKETLRIAPTIQ